MSAMPPIASELMRSGELTRREWDGPAVLPPLTARKSVGVHEHEEQTAMSCKAEVAVAHTIGIDTGKNALHMIGLDEKGAIVLREKVSRSRIAARLVNVPPCPSPTISPR